MCFYVNNIPIEIKISVPEPLIAEKDIVCYKIINEDKNGTIESQRGYIYYKEKLDTNRKNPIEHPVVELIINPKFPSSNVDIKENIKIKGEIENGYHSYINIGTAYAIHKNSSYGGLIFITPSYAKSKLARFYIPKGAKYYINEEDGEYVSSTIKFDEIIKDELLIIDPKLK
jgi:hypothetical protein